jgi:50S ribosomal subunit-associated GTPase HflX
MGKPRIYVFNKTDRIEQEEAQFLALRFDAVTVSALDRKTLRPLLSAIEAHIFQKLQISH